MKRRAKHADHIECAMLEEALVFGSKHGMNQHRGQIVEAHHAAFLARTIEEICQQLRLDLGEVGLRSIR